MNKNIARLNIDLRGLYETPISFCYEKTSEIEIDNRESGEFSSLKVYYEDLRSKSGVFKKCGKKLFGKFETIPLSITAVTEKIKNVRHGHKRDFLLYMIDSVVDSLTAEIIWVRKSDRIIDFGRKRFGILTWMKSWWSSKADRVMVYFYQLGNWIVFVHCKTSGSIFELEMGEIIETQVFYRNRLYSVARKDETEPNKYSFYLINDKFTKECLALTIAGMDGVDTYNYSH